MNQSEHLAAWEAEIRADERAKVLSRIAAAINDPHLEAVPPKIAKIAQSKQRSGNGQVKRRKRSPTVANDQEISAVAMAMREGETVTVAKLKDLTKDGLNPKGIGQTTVAAACKALCTRGVFEQVGRNGYRLTVQPTAEQEHLENGEDSSQESPEAGG